VRITLIELAAEAGGNPAGNDNADHRGCSQ
jgi:hypothetical protein